MTGTFEEEVDEEACAAEVEGELPFEDEADEDWLYVLVPDELDLDELFDGGAELDAVEPEPDEEVDEKALDEHGLLREAEQEIDDELDEEYMLALARGSHRAIVALVKVATALAFILFPLPLFYGWQYYSQPLVERPLHAFHAVLRPSGSFGLSVGLAGTALILASLAYLVRKHLVRKRMTSRSVRSWMRFHVVTGVLGPALVLLHSGFLPTSALGIVSLSAMLVVVMSGMVGRYLLVFLPRAGDEGELGREGVRRRLKVYKKKLIGLGLNPRLLGETGERDAGGKRRPWLVPAVMRVITGDRESREEFRRIKEAVAEQHGDDEEARLILILLRRLIREREFLVRYHELRRIIGAWRFLHRWLAVVLILGACFHILVAVRHGDLWILGGGP